MPPRTTRRRGLLQHGERDHTGVGKRGGEQKAGEASAIAPMDYSRLIYATLIGWWIFAELPNPTTVAGAALIVVASVITMRSARQSENR